MKIKKKMFLMFTCMISIILFLSNTFIYALFNKSTKDSIMHYQQSSIETNQLLINNFLDSILETILQLIGDKSIGENLSITDLDDDLVRLNVRAEISNQFSHYSATQILRRNHGYRNTLFLNNNLPIAKSFQSYSLDSNPYVSISNIFSDEAIVGSLWYEELISDSKNPYVFVNESTDEFCFAQKIQNNYYTGPYYSNGVGVMVISLKMKYLEENFSFITISPNSDFVILNNKDELLYQSGSEIPTETFMQANNLNQPSNKRQPFFITLNNEKYITNINNLNYGLKLLFLTPYSDIQNSISEVMSKYLLFIFFITIIILIFIYLLSGKMTKPIIQFSNTISNIKDTRTFDVQTLQVSKDKEMQILCDSFQTLIERINQLIESIQKESEEKKRSELRALQAQINPHFIFNAMDIVNWIALSRKNDDIANIVSSIATMMRYTITEPENMVKITDEIQNIKEYITIYKLRHPSEIILNVNSSEDLDKILIPKFSLQPLVENCIKHGLSDDDNNLNDFHIFINIRKEESYVIIDVIDDGVSCDPIVMNDFLNYKETYLKVSHGFGIRNVNERIQLKFRGNSGLSYLLNKDGKLIARISLDYTNYCE